MTTRFLLLTTPRSGTMMLTDTLSTYDQVRWHNLYAANPDNPAGSYRAWESFQEVQEIGVTHRGTTMHKVGNGWIKNLSPIPLEEFWQVVHDRHDRWILLRRENLLRQYLSHQVGIVLRSYHVSKPRAKDPGPVRIQMQPFFDHVGSIELLQERIDPYFPGALRLSYEELSDNWAGSFRKVQDYLGIPRKDIPPVTFKQETRPLSEAIENYEDVKQYLIHRGYEHWTE